ncbi:MAG: hypothetical protein KF816_06520 [Melioribacteraceae bacterium]|nr:hypothetical protein [Melioribacteraceae bacterium]
MDYLIIRDLKLADQEAFSYRYIDKKIGDIGQATFPYGGGTEKRYKFKVGEICWMCVKEIGVFTKEKVIQRNDVRIENEADVIKLRNSTIDSLKIDEKYWDREINRINTRLSNPKIKPNKKYVHITLIDTETIEILEKPFPVEQYFPDDGYIELDEEKKNKYFELFDRKILPDLIKYNNREYSTINDAVKLDIISLYGNNKTFFGSTSPKIKIDNDHFVPSSLGGPGRFIQNVLPIQASCNRSKNNNIPIALIKIAKKYINFPKHDNNEKELTIIGKDWDSVLNNWDNPNYKKGLSSYEKKSLTITITNYIKNFDELIQRRFYYEVVKEGLLNNFKDTYSKCSTMQCFNIEEIYNQIKSRDINGRLSHIYEILDYELYKVDNTIIVKNINAEQSL